MNPSLLVFALGVAAPPSEVTVVLWPLESSAETQNVAYSAMDELTASFKSFQALKTVSGRPFAQMFGKAQAEKIAQCPDDVCRVQAMSGLSADFVLFGQLLSEGGRTQLKLRLVEVKAPERPVVRISRELGDGASALSRVMGEIATELFPDRAGSAEGMLVITGTPLGAQVLVDGALAGLLSPSPQNNQLVLRLPPGPHAVSLNAPRHHPGDEVTVEVLAGKSTRLDLHLSLRRSMGPYILGATGLVAAGTAVVVGVLAQDKVDSWASACDGGQPCTSGFTRFQYLEDQKTVDASMVGTNILIGTASAALLGAVLWYLFDPGEDAEEEVW